jgi:ribosomal protein RSM22 (predicted rRNA methylase)
VLPAHYSAITSVLRHVKSRLGPLWDVDRIIDWGTGTGSGLWFVSLTSPCVFVLNASRASIYAFQENLSQSGQDELEHSAATSKIKSYLGIDKRDGLVTIGKRLKNSKPTRIRHDFAS